MTKYRGKGCLTILLIPILLVIISVVGLKFYLFSDSAEKVNSITKKLNSKKVMIVFAHPDDESYTTGLLQDAEKEGIKTALLTFTPGDAGTQMPQVCQQQFLGDVRKAEVYQSGFVLGVDYQKVFDYGDGTLINQDIKNLVSDIITELNKFQPDLVVTFWPESGMTMHEDHMTIGKATELAFTEYSKQKPQVKAKLAYTIMPEKVVSLLGGGEMLKLQHQANLSIKAKASAKIRLWEIHASQHDFVKSYTGMPAGLVYRLLDREYYYVKGK